MIKEWNILRVVACLSVVLLHSSTQVGRSIGYTNLDDFFFARIILTYATPTFIVLSEIILANRYKEELPPNFFSKRVKFILIPFISFAVIDALVVNFLSINGIDILDKIYSNLMGNYIGYFILIIFQFYILHYLILKFNISVEKLLPWSIIIMVMHLALLNSNHELVLQYKPYLKLPFTAWFGYFTVAFLIGKNYERIASILRKYKWVTLITLLYVIYFIFLSIQSGNIQVDSRRLDIFPLSIAISFFILAWGQILPKSKIINLISNYSLGIYLLHWQIQRIIMHYLSEELSYFNPYIQILILFIFATVISMILIKIISLFTIGKYIIGNTKKNIKSTSPKVSSS
ncbi:acyltransferase family protein [Oceanobacillus kimchii]|uniref:acyltransferase family protein n=1 Tax=Oceanobacillus kimchii TaxID=746691 RepID=UPI0009875A17|nr:acyltransferase family protein [Oceanobacillus kimchii]